ncbi:hypothetical protein FISHEDRAFT_76285 [Fistulina hepatica ATCC 64428]|uniref:Uncharacterized protein n=1 Tax=Fistulina hepatica ATCC 64428 TaxID=1128425 RepID=A0A0D7A5R8_9AGAR|nr:hypothetical protein FISHEDRAFT_76285 [Fistulina hepatica ATCC 64428]
MAEILTCRHCGHDAFPPFPTRSFDVHELKEALRGGFLPSSLTMKCIEQEVANLEATIKEVNNMLEDARAALVQGLNPTVEYLAIARSVSSPIRRLPEELLSNIFSYLITSFNNLRDAMFEAGISGRCCSTIHRLASVCKYWWRVVRDTSMLFPAYISNGDKSVLAVRRYIEMTSPHPLKFFLSGFFHPAIHKQQMEVINYRAIVQELVNASSRWQTADLFALANASSHGQTADLFALVNASDIDMEIAACVYHSSYPVLKELCLRSFPMSQFFSQEQVPVLRVLKIDKCQIELQAVQPILLQITNLDLDLFEGINVDLDFHAMLSYAPALSHLTVESKSTNLEILLHIQSDARSPVLLPHLRRLQVTCSIFVLDIITAPNLVHFHLIDDSSHSSVVDTFLHRSRCNIKSLHLGFHIPGTTSSIAKQRTPDGRFSVFPLLQHLEIGQTQSNSVVSDIMRVVRKRCGARKIRVEGRTGYRKSKKLPVLRRLDISCPLTPLQHRTLLALSECGALDVCCSVSGKPAECASSDDDSDNSDGEEEDSSDGDDDGVAYI